VSNTLKAVPVADFWQKLYGWLLIRLRGRIQQNYDIPPRRIGGLFARSSWLRGEFKSLLRSHYNWTFYLPPCFFQNRIQGDPAGRPYN